MAKRTSRRGARRQRRPARSVATAPTLADALRDACHVLEELRVPHALVGGLAVSARAEPRLTRDVDVAIDAADDGVAETIVGELVARKYEVTATVEQTKVERLATVRLVSPVGGAFIVDLLFASCGIEAEICAAAERLEILPDLVAPIARAGHLIAMKLLARDDRERPQDFDDIRRLFVAADVNERRRVTKSIALIAERGFSRGRDLAKAWRTLQADLKA